MAVRHYDDDPAVLVEPGEVEPKPKSDRNRITSTQRLTRYQVESLQERGSLLESARRTLFLIAGPVGSTSLTLICLTAVRGFESLVSPWLVEVAAAIILIRLYPILKRPAAHSLTGSRLRSQPIEILHDEFVFGLGFLAVCFLLAWPMAPRLASAFIAVNTVLQGALFFAGRGLLRAISKRQRITGQTADTRKVIIVGTGPKALRLADRFLDSPELEMSPIGFFDYHRYGHWRYRDLPLMGHPRLLTALVGDDQIDAVFLAVEVEDLSGTAELFADAEKMGVNVGILADIFPATIARPGTAEIDDIPLVTYHTTCNSTAPHFCKTLLDRMLALVILLVTAPLLFVLALVIKLDSRGPVFFRQVRLGLNGRRFGLYKFRTMCPDAERKQTSLWDQNEMSGPVFKIKNDPRITRIGRFLRKYSLDEFPQLINVLKGDMSLVGPRPPLPKEVAKFEPWQRRKLSVKPGLTCLWQVNGRNTIDFDHWMKLDLEYIDNWSLALDAQILAKTVPTVLKGSGS
ncbi:MAG TPA: sugar transferase [Candidatus Acidoferrum sp.]|nr:sugar transferase [Candidatus Acidoferrum sp.]